MKILHALAGYLAVMALPFHMLFVFASPLAAIHYDGYVNTQNHTGTLMQNHSDNALMKFVPSDIIKAYRAAYVPKVLIIAAAIVVAIVLCIIWVRDDDLEEAIIM